MKRLTAAGFERDSGVLKTNTGKMPITLILMAMKLNSSNI